jgi:hypothetical protein
MTMTHLRRVLGLCLLGFGLWALGVVEAHHSQSEFDLRAKVDVEGTVTRVDWRSPHVWIYVDASNAKGEMVNWSLELPSPNTLMRRGWTRDSLKPGDRIKVNAAPARNHPAIAIANSIRDASGKPLFTGTTPISGPDIEPRQ